MKPETQANSKQFWQDHVNQWNENSISQASYCQETLI
ncbi:IS66 family insertion sequence element accessory protein TnpA [sulfur-oxidizing endosymbiont of Gigantopelta aegis]